MSRRTVDDWRRAVFAASDLSANVRLLLIFLADHMRERDKHISVPRAKVAKGLGWAEQRVSERLKLAVDHGFLYPKSPGYRGHTAEYQGTFPDVPQVESVRKNRSLSRSQKDGRFQGGKRPENTDTSTRAEPSASPYGGNEERSNEQPCRWHMHAGCPADCADHPDTRRRTA